jgi:hypothetical protein
MTSELDRAPIVPKMVIPTMTTPVSIKRYAWKVMYPNPGPPDNISAATTAIQAIPTPIVVPVITDGIV